MDYETVLPDGRVKPPFSPPDCPWKSMNSKSEIPDNAVEFGKLNGDSIYIGRVYDNKCWLVGTAIPQKKMCIYLSKESELKTTDSYDILTVDCGNPLEFGPVDFESRLLFVSAGDQDHVLYAARVVDGENTYIGWVDKSNGVAHIPRADKANNVKDNYDVLIHKFLDRLCICPMPPPYSYQ